MIHHHVDRKKRENEGQEKNNLFHRSIDEQYWPWAWGREEEALINRGCVAID